MDSMETSWPCVLEGGSREGISITGWLLLFKAYDAARMESSDISNPFLGVWFMKGKENMKPRDEN